MSGRLVADRLGSCAGLVAFGAMLLTPATTRGGRARRALTALTVAAGAVRTAATDVRARGTARGVGVTASTLLVAAVVERDGVRSGRWFGAYRYTGALRPQVAGVPVLVPLAWVAMAPPAHATAHAALGRRSNPGARIVAGAVALTAWDLFVDPQMTREGYWQWSQRGPYRGVPLRNFAGWLLTSAALLALRELVAGPPDERHAGHVTTYATVGVMETAGFATFFRDRFVAVVGGVPMLSFAALALARRR